MSIDPKKLLLINEAHLYLSKDRSLYIGRVGESMSVSRAPAVLILALDGDIAFELQKVSPKEKCSAIKKTVRSIVLPADCSAQLTLNNALIAIFFLDFIGEDIAVLKKGAKQLIPYSSGHVIVEPELTGMVTEFVSDAYLVRKGAKTVFKGLEALVSERRKKITQEDGFTVDKRIVQAINYIRTPDGLLANIEQISKHVSLSVPRFTQLFRLVTGISVRRFKIWYRMYLASELLAQGKSFTEAAVGAGFSDYAHFSRSFTEMGGVAPSVMLYGSQDLYLDVYYREYDGATLLGAMSANKKSNHVVEEVL